jgi:hypothetical protein
MGPFTWYATGDALRHVDSDNPRHTRRGITDEGRMSFGGIVEEETVIEEWRIIPILIIPRKLPASFIV